VAGVKEVGELRHRIRIEQKTRTGTPGAYTGETWSELKSVWSKYEPLAGREIVVADDIVHRQTCRFTIRRRTDVTAAMRVIYKGRTFAILGVRDLEDGGWRWTELTCEEDAPS
jgi:SPP1 family predicted phage head-tail adaptor